MSDCSNYSAVKVLNVSGATIMSRGKLLLFVTLFLVFSLGTSRAQSPTAAVVTGHVFAEVIPIFSASEISQLYFGKFAPGPQGGEIILTPQSTVSILGSVFVGSGIHNAASFYITGDNDATFSVTLPSAPATLTNPETSKTMLVTNWVSVPGDGIGTGKMENGCQTVFVGATLKVGTLEENPPGVYIGSYVISFDFN